MSKRQKQAKNSLRSEIIGVLFATIGLLLLSSLTGFRMGSFGESIENIFLYAFGKGAWLIALLFFVIGIRYIWRQGKNIYTKNLAGIILFFVFLLTLFHQFISPANSELLPTYLQQGGGIFCGLIVFFIRKILGVDGSSIFMLAITLCSAIFAFKLSIKKTATTAGKSVNTAANKVVSASKQLKKPHFFNYEDHIFDMKDDTKQKETPIELPIEKVDFYKKENVVIFPHEDVPEKVLDIDNVKTNLDVEFAENFSDKEPSLPDNIVENDIVTTENSLIEDYNIQEEFEEDILKEDKKLKNNNSFYDFNEESNSNYRFPSTSLLMRPVVDNSSINNEEVLEQAKILEQTLTDFKVSARIVNIVNGPSVTRFEVEPAPGVKVNRIVSLVDDLTLRLAASGIRIETSIPGKSAMGIEVPKKNTTPVSFHDVISSQEFQSETSKLAVALGKDITGKTIIADIGKMPHVLVAGSTGSGKSVCINTIINSILFKALPDEVKFIMIDPKVVELSTYNGIPHLLTPVVTNAKKAASALFWAVEEMEKRYNAFAQAGVREISRYNKYAAEKLPYIVIIIDELADLMMVAPADVEDAICRLAQKARAAGIHLILATQRPSVDVITGIIKANIPSRIAFAVSSQIDSRTILDSGGAEKLLGKGDMLYYPVGMSKPQRLQGAFISDDDIEAVTEQIKTQSIPVEYTENITEHLLPSDKSTSLDGSVQSSSSQDELLIPALEIVIPLGQASASLLQRRLRIGYTRAARIIDYMEEFGIVGPATGTSKPRDILMSYDEAISLLLPSEDS